MVDDHPEHLLMGKGIKNTLSIAYTDCNATENSLDSSLRMFWYLHKIEKHSSHDQGKSIEQESSINGACVDGKAVEQIAFEANQLLPGDYLFKAYVFDKSYPEAFVVFERRMIVGASQLIIQVNSPYYVELNWNEHLVMDFLKDSYDPDEDAVRIFNFIFFLLLLYYLN